MRFSAALLTSAVAAVSAQTLEDLTNISPEELSSYSGAIASITANPAYSSLVASIATADPTSLYEEANSYANSALGELSAEAATATGSDAAFLSGLYTSVQAGLSSANAYATSALNYSGAAGATPAGTAGTTGGSSSSDNSGDSSASGGAESQTGNGAVATSVPIALGAVGMAVLGML